MWARDQDHKDGDQKSSNELFVSNHVRKSVIVKENIIQSHKTPTILLSDWIYFNFFYHDQKIGTMSLCKLSEAFFSSQVMRKEIMCRCHSIVFPLVNIFIDYAHILLKLRVPVTIKDSVVLELLELYMMTDNFVSLLFSLTLQDHQSGS